MSPEPTTRARNLFLLGIIFAHPTKRNARTIPASPLSHSSSLLPLRLSIRTLINITHLIRPPNPTSSLSQLRVSAILLILTTDHRNALRHFEVPILVRKLVHILTCNPARGTGSRLVKSRLASLLIAIILRRGIGVQLLTIANGHVQREAGIGLARCCCVAVAVGLVFRGRRGCDNLRGCEADLQVLDVLVRHDVRVGQVQLEQDGGADLRVHGDGRVGDARAFVGRGGPEGQVPGGN